MNAYPEAFKQPQEKPFFGLLTYENYLEAKSITDYNSN